MAHDFSIRAVGTEETAYFFGYCNGIMYVSFDCNEFNGGVSGTGNSTIIDRDAAIEGMVLAILYFDSCGYPDPHRMDEIKSFYQEVKNGKLKNIKQFEICFS